MDQSEHKQEPKQTGWKSLADLLQKKHELFENTLLLEGFDFSSNIYVIGGDYLTIVDPGNDYTAYMDLFSLDYEPAAIRKIVLTHGHQDHAMGIFELLRSYPSVFDNEGLELILHEAAPPQLKEMPKEAGCRVTELRGGETLELSGFEWEVIYSPGHTIDGVCLYHSPTRTLFSGDMVMPHAIGSPDETAGGSLDHYLFSMRSLLKRDIENILPGHGGPVAVEARKVIEETYEGVIMKALEIEAEAKVSWFEGATQLAERGLLEEGVFCCEKELDRHPENTKAMELKALCLNDLGRCDEAIEIFDNLLAQRSDNTFALVGKGYGLLGLGRFDDALKFFDDALAINPDIKEARVYKGMALYLSGRHQEAMDIEDFQKEFVDRFKQELDKKDRPSDQPSNH
jgi:glyoxylase-like metal-dependent hydrolase (beta-lactamase superfamily II)